MTSTPQFPAATVTRYRQKPIVIEAVHWEGAQSDLPSWMPPVTRDVTGIKWPGSIPSGQVWRDDNDLVISTLEGHQIVQPGDWIIRGVKDEISLCKPDIFAAFYEPVTSEPAPVSAATVTREMIDAADKAYWAVVDDDFVDEWDAPARAAIEAALAAAPPTDAIRAARAKPYQSFDDWWSALPNRNERPSVCEREAYAAGQLNAIRSAAAIRAEAFEEAAKTVEGMARNGRSLPSEMAAELRAAARAEGDRP